MFSRVGSVRATLLVKHDGSGTQTGRWHFGPSGSRSIQVFAARQPLRRIAPRIERVEEEARTVPRTWPGTAEGVWEQARAVATPFLPMFERVPPERWDEINSQVYRAISMYIVGNDIKFGAVVVLASGRKP